MTSSESITSVEFREYRAFRHYSVKLSHMNILVGPNNSGKSTILSAFRTLEAGLRIANSKRATVVTSPTGQRLGYQIATESVAVPIEYVHTNYVDVDTAVIFRISNGNKLILYFPKHGGCNLIPDTQGKQCNTPDQFKNCFPINIQIIPVLGPVEHNEKLLNEETVRRGLSTHRASRHFRNYWYYYPHGFAEFADLVKKTWPGMEIV